MTEIPEKFKKPYNPTETESKIYKLWEESGYFNPDNLPGQRQKTFTIMMPPPNVTGVLHMGHAYGKTIQDIIIRYKRMRGFKALYLPGTDHAAIATQAKVEKEVLKKEGKTRHDLGREEMLKRIEDFAQNSHDTMVKQMKTLGLSCDWSREAFTLDNNRTKAVRTIFKQMYDDGLIYRGHRIVNWDPKGQTTIADDEIVYQEERTKFYYFKYGPFVIGTARPETKFGDKYVVINPKDERYKDYKHGQKITVEWINGPIEATIIKDEIIDMEFGTGVMTITPWHSLVDFELAEKYNLDKEQIIDKYGKLMTIAGEFAGMKISEARDKIVAKLEQKGLLVKIEDYTHNIATAERTNGVIEPQIMNQWFVDVNKPFKPKGKTQTTTLKEIMREKVEKEEIKLLPDYFNKTYFHWIDNLRDWCISRQIWYGHRIPVWYKEGEIYCGVEAPEGSDWIQDEDTLDTWFSSGLWTFSTLGWPDKTTDLENFHPTDIIVPAYEILFFWIARMIMMTGYTLDAIPFKTVYLTGVVRDGQGRKFSKSLGNGIDPIDIADKFGMDAGRMALIVGTAPGTDSKISEDKIKAYKHFANKIWNATRFVLENTSQTEKVDLEPIDQKYLEDFNIFTKELTEDLDQYRLHLAAEKIYHYFWHTFADIIIEESKSILNSDNQLEKKSREYLLRHILDNCLVIIHPFMPFITEEIWQLMNKDNLLMVESWPNNGNNKH